MSDETSPTPSEQGITQLTGSSMANEVLFPCEMATTDIALPVMLAIALAANHLRS